MSVQGGPFALSMQSESALAIFAFNLCHLVFACGNGRVVLGLLGFVSGLSGRCKRMYMSVMTGRVCEGLWLCVYSKLMVIDKI